MREIPLLAIAVVAALLGMGLGRLLLPKKSAPVPAPVVSVDVTPVVKVASVTRIVPEALPLDPVDPNSTPEAVHAWRRQDKDALVRQVESVSNAEAEHVCFLLQLIPRDEVFDKINVKGRLKHHIDDMRSAAEFSDVEGALREATERR